jgi:hypothetical protein
MSVERLPLYSGKQPDILLVDLIFTLGRNEPLKVEKKNKKYYYYPLILIAHSATGQYLFFITPTIPAKIDLKFIKHNVEACRGKTIFNVGISS